MTLDAIGKTYGITRERVRQIENYAIANIRKSDAYKAEKAVFTELENLIHSLGGVVVEDDFLGHVTKDKALHNHINFLLGRFPQYVERDASKFLDLKLQQLSVGFPAQMLQNRADVRQAERELQAAGLDVRVARARFYPALNLRAGVGYEAFNTRYLFDSPDSLIYNVGGDLIAPLINKKAIQADYLTANAEQLQAIYDYQQTVLTAFTEVVNRLSKVENYGKSIEIKREQLASLEASVDSATKLFQSARIEYMDVLFSQRDLMEARMVLIETKQQQLAAIVNAYQALGGGAAPSTGIAALPTPLPPPEIILEQPIELKREEDLPQAAPAPELPTAEPLPPIPGVQLQNPVDPRANTAGPPVMPPQPE